MCAAEDARPQWGSGEPVRGEQPPSAARWLTEPEGLALVQGFDVPVPAFEVAVLDEEAVLSAADIVGYPLVLKVISPDILHKSDAGAVLTGIQDAASLAGGLESMLRLVRSNVPGARLDGVLVEAEAPPGIELIVGAQRDPQFGPVVAVGLGGTLVELLADVALRLAPVLPSEAAEMIDETRVGTALGGLRGSPSLDRAAVERLLLGVSRLAADRSEVLELDLNPVRVYPRGLMALDVRLRVSATGLTV